MPVIAIAVMLALTVPLCAKEKREWQDGVVLDVSPPSGRRASNTPPNPTGSATQMGGGTPSVPVLESTAGREIWIWFISVKAHTYAAGYDRPPRKSFLGALRRGQQVKAFVDNRHVYLLDTQRQGVEAGPRGQVAAL